MQDIQDTSDWRSNPSRQKAIQHIEQAIRLSGNPMGKSSAELESHLFEKAASREEYLGYLGRILLHIRKTRPSSDSMNALHFMASAGAPSQQQGTAGMPQSSAVGQQAANSTLNQQPANQQQAAMFAPSSVTMSTTQPDLATAAAAAAMSVSTPSGPQPAPNSSPAPAAMYHQMQHHTQQRFMQQQQQNIRLTRQQSPMPRSIVSPSAPAHAYSPQQSLHMYHVQQPGASPSSRPLAPPHGAQSPYSHHMSAAQQTLPSGGGTGVGVMSPQLHTPASVQPIPSPQHAQMMQMLQQQQQTTGTREHPTPSQQQSSSGGAATHTDVQYMEKIKQLAKYIDPIKRMIENSQQDTAKQTKMRKLLDILENPSRQHSLDLLLRCEQVLEKIEIHQHPAVVSAAATAVPSSVGSAVPVSGAAVSAAVCTPSIFTNCKEYQVLLDSVYSVCSRQTAGREHTLQRTFRPLHSACTQHELECLTSTVMPAYLLPFAKQPQQTDEEDSRRDKDAQAFSDCHSVLKREISINSKLHGLQIEEVTKRECAGVPGVLLRVSFTDSQLAFMPSLHIHLPLQYPDDSPVLLKSLTTSGFGCHGNTGTGSGSRGDSEWRKMCADESGCCQMQADTVVGAIDRCFRARVKCLPENFTLTQMLRCWHQAVALYV